MSMSEFKNESLYQARISEADARRTVAYALHMGWAHPPVTPAHPAHPPHDKKHTTAAIRIGVESLLPYPPSDVSPPA